MVEHRAAAQKHNECVLILADGGGGEDGLVISRDAVGPEVRLLGSTCVILLALMISMPSEKLSRPRPQAVWLPHP